MHYNTDEPVLLKFARDAATPQKDRKPRKPKEKKKKLVPKSFWLRHLVEFFRTTGLHGYKYIVMEDTPAYERCFWAVAVAISLAAAVSLVFIAWEWNLQNPTIIVIESTHYQTWNYPYPAVTVCSLNKVSKNVALNMSKKLNIPPQYNLSSKDIFEQLRYASVLLGNTPITNDLKEPMKLLQVILDYNNITVKKLMKKVTPSCGDMLDKCWWKSTKYRCDTIFQDVISSDGVCCSFNYHGSIVSEFAVKPNLIEFKNPRRVASCGANTGLTLLMKVDSENYYSSTFGTFGLRVFIHDPYDFPDDNAAPKLVGPDTEAFIEIDAEVTYATDDIIKMPISKRKCIMSKEGITRAFKSYTYGNCLAECRSKIVQDRCGCVPIFLPSTGKDKVCNFLDASCVYKTRQLYSSSLPETNVSCNCMPECERQAYAVEISTGAFSRTASHNSEDIFKNLPRMNQSLLHVYFNDLMGTRYRIDIFMSWYGLLASFGGLLGLFIGFSLVSAFELVYFFTVRFFFDMLHKDQLSKGENSKVESDPGLSENQLFNRWVEKHHIAPLSTPNNKSRF